MGKRKRCFLKWIFAGMLLILQCVMLSGFTGSAAEKEEEEVKETGQLYAQSVVLMDGETGRVLFEKNGNEERPMASTTKIMTCILALERGNPQDIVVVSKEAAGQPEVHLEMREGEKFYLNDLLYSMMLESHNDSAWAVAEQVGGSVEGFAKMMNEKAREIGCDKTHFVTPNGLDGKDSEGIHHTTAADLARIMRYCIEESPKREEFLKITQTREKTITDTTKKQTYILRNHNAFLDMMDGVLSGKTGFTTDAGYCYVGAVKQGDKTFIVALLACGWPNNKGYKWKDMRTMVQYGIDNYSYYNYWKEAEKCKEIRQLEAGKTQEVKNAPSETGNLYENGTVKLFLELSDEEKEKRILKRKGEEIHLQIEKKKVLQAPLKQGERVGKVTVLLNGQKLAENNIVVGENVQEKTLFWVYKNIWMEFLI